MRLYLFEHCSLCFRVRMTAALKRLHLQETVVLDDDSETMIGLVGKRVVPILVKNDGKPMLESMDMVHYVDSLGERCSHRTRAARDQHMGRTSAAQAISADLAPISAPWAARVRNGGCARPLQSAQAQSDRRLRRATRHTRQHINALMPDLEELDHLIESSRRRQRNAISGRYSRAAAPAFGRGRQRVTLPQKGTRLFRDDDEPYRLRTPSDRLRRSLMKRMHVHVAVDDLSRSIGFYSALFDAKPAVVKPDYAKWMLDDPRVNFAISTRGRTPGSITLAFRSRTKPNCTRSTHGCTKPAGPSSSKERRPVVMPNRRNPGSMIRLVFPGKPSTQPGKTPTTETVQANGRLG